jgi:hypothetical protein
MAICTKTPSDKNFKILNIMKDLLIKYDKASCPDVDTNINTLVLRFLISQMEKFSDKS